MRSLIAVALACFAVACSGDPTRVEPIEPTPTPQPTQTGICDDGNPCTEDIERDGACRHRVRDCDDDNACTEDSCEAGVGCQHSPVLCEDGDACTEDTCDPASGCMRSVRSCDDGDACTVDRCSSEQGCHYGERDCNDDDPCTNDSCDAATGCVNAALDCDDDDACTVDLCDPQVGCRNAPRDCSDAQRCTRDSCDAASGECVHTPDDSLCVDDTLFCDAVLGCDADQGCIPAGAPCPTEQICREDRDACTDGTLPLRNCTVDFDFSCPEDGRECDLRFGGRRSTCLDDGRRSCVASGGTGMLVDTGDLWVITADGEGDAVNDHIEGLTLLFAAGSSLATGRMQFFDAKTGGNPIAQTLMTSSNCTQGKPGLQSIWLDAPARRVEIVASNGPVWVDALTVNPPRPDVPAPLATCTLDFEGDTCAGACGAEIAGARCETPLVSGCVASGVSALALAADERIDIVLSGDLMSLTAALRPGASSELELHFFDADDAPVDIPLTSRDACNSGSAEDPRSVRFSRPVRRIQVFSEDGAGWLDDVVLNPFP